VRGALDERIRGVPRLRQCLRRPPPGCGRPVWVDDPAFAVAHHVHERACPPPSDDRALRAVTIDLVTTDLPGDRPLWSATLITGLADGSAAIVLAFHHVMADGMGGLAVLAQLVDGAPPAAVTPFPRPAPSWGALAVEAQRGHLRALTHGRRGARALRAAVHDLRIVPGATGAPACWLNHPVGDHRYLDVARTDLAAVHAFAHNRGATVNDALLVLIGEAVAGFLQDRGEDVDHLVVMNPVASRPSARADQLGNQFGAMPVTVPLTGPLADRMAAVAAVTGGRKQEIRAGSAAFLVPVFRFLGATRIWPWLTNRQHMVSTFVTNLRGPTEPVSFRGRAVTGIVPVNGMGGNVRVAFAVFSYAGELTVTVVGDAAVSSELADITARLQHGLDRLAKVRSRS
jgi:diacylglycerol O-acyltransferase